MCSFAMARTHPGRLFYGASDMELSKIIALPGAEPARTVFAIPARGPGHARAFCVRKALRFRKNI